MVCPGGAWVSGGSVSLICVKFFIPKIVHRHFWHRLNNPFLRAIFGDFFLIIYLFFGFGFGGGSGGVLNQLGQDRRRWVRGCWLNCLNNLWAWARLCFTDCPNLYLTNQLFLFFRKDFVSCLSGPLPPSPFHKPGKARKPVVHSATEKHQHVNSSIQNTIWPFISLAFFFFSFKLCT
jgi:hypothetical protein